MHRIYSNPDLAIVHLARHELQKRGIDSIVRGDNLQSVGVPSEWPELWLVDAGKIEEAAEIIQNVVDSYEEEEEESAPWTCPTCGEEVEPQFAVCWNCGTQKPESRS